MITILPAENLASLRNTTTSRLYGTRSTGTPVIRNYYRKKLPSTPYQKLYFRYEKSPSLLVLINYRNRYDLT